MNKFRVYWALARGVALEAIRRKDLWVVAILGFLAISTAGALGFFGFQGLQVFAKDLGLNVLGAFSTIVTVITATRLAPDEIKNRTLYPLLARPISRVDFLIGKWIGATLVSWTAFALLGLTVAVALAIFGVQFEWILLQYAFCKALGLAVLAAVSITLSLYMTQSAATTLSLIVAFASGMVVRALTMAASTAPGLKPVFAFVNALTPQYGLFDLSGRAANLHWAPVPFWVVGTLIVYAALYCAAMTSLSWLKFRRQAL